MSKTFKKRTGYSTSHFWERVDNVTYSGIATLYWEFEDLDIFPKRVEVVTCPIVRKTDHIAPFSEAKALTWLEVPSDVRRRLSLLIEKEVRKRQYDFFKENSLDVENSV